MTGETPPRVARSEDAMLALARALIAGATDDALDRMRDVVAPAPAIGPTCARLLEDTLAQVWRTLWRRGGARPEVAPSGARGRLWERHPVTPLAFSARTVELLRWMIASPLVPPRRGQIRQPWPYDLPPLALGDQVIVYLALDAARGCEPALLALASTPVVRAAPLAWLGFPDLLLAPPPPAFDALVTGAGPLVVEALAGELARRWTASMLAQRAITRPDAVRVDGERRDAVLTGFLDACDRHGRRDLASFVLDAIAPLLARDLAPTPVALDPTAPLAERAVARRASGALLRAVRRWAAWDAEHRAVRFIDDDYAAAQHLLARFERVGPAGAARVERWLADLTALPAPPA